MPDAKYELISRELIRALRGSRSQIATCRRLKRRSNVLHAWETGKRYPGTSDLVQLLLITGKSPRDILLRFAPCRPGAPRTLVTSWLNGLAGNRSQAELAKSLGVNRNTIARWLSGRTEPRLPELLAFVEATTQRLLDLVAALVSTQQVPSIADEYADLQHQRDLAYGRPWAHAVLRALELEPCRREPRYTPGFVANATGIPLDEEAACLRALLQAGQVKRLRGRYQLRRVLAVDTRADPERNLALKRHWFKVASERLERDGIHEAGLASYNLFAIAEDDLERVREAHLEYYQRLRAIVAESKNPTRVVLATVGLMPLGQKG